MTSRPADIAETIAGLLTDQRSADVTRQALELMDALFGRKAGEGVAMARRALRLAVDPDQVATLCVAFTERILGNA